MLPKLVIERYEKEGKTACQNCGIYSKNGYLCRKCFDEKYPKIAEDYRIDYWKHCVHAYSEKHSLPLQISAVELLRLSSQFWDDWEMKEIKKETEKVKKKWFLLGYVIGSVVVAALLQIF